MTVGLALWGGPSRGAAQLGMMKCLMENEVPVDGILGCGTGGLIGALLACGLTPDEAAESYIKLRPLLPWEHRRRGLWQKLRREISFDEGRGFERRLDELLAARGARMFSHCALPFVLVGADLIKKGPVCYIGSKGAFYSGDDPRYRAGVPLSRAVRIGMSSPLLFDPRALPEGLYCDGSLLGKRALFPLTQMGAKKILVLCARGGLKVPAGPNFAFAGMCEMMQRRADEELADEGRFVLCCEEDEGDFLKNMERGYQKMREQLPALFQFLYF